MALVGEVVRRDVEEIAELLRDGGVDANTSRLDAIRPELGRAPAPACLVADLCASVTMAMFAESYCENVSTSVVVVTDLADATSRVRAIEYGAADHLVSPFEAREGAARVQRLVARHTARRDSRVAAGDLTFDLARQIVLRNGRRIDLTGRELAVLLALARETPRVVSKRELLQQVWGGALRTQNLVEATISSLRRKLERTGPRVIHTNHGHGYSFRPVPPAPAGRVDVAAERDRLIRERDEIIARRDEAIARLRAQLAIARRSVAFDVTPSREDDGRVG